LTTIESPRAFGSSANFELAVAWAVKALRVSDLVQRLRAGSAYCTDGMPCIRISRHRETEASSSRIIEARADIRNQPNDRRLSLPRPFLKEANMKLATIALAAFFAISGSLACAQTTQSGSSKPYTPSYDTSGKGHGPSGSGSSTSGGRDDSGDEGRDKMPEANAKVRPAPGKPDIPNAANQK
jgi:hypothetical protein